VTPSAPRRSFLVLAANTPWVFALAEQLERYGPVTVVRFIDWLNQRRLRPEWPETASDLRRVATVMPPGYAGALEPAFRGAMRRRVEGEGRRLQELSGCEPAVICPYPYLAPWVRGVPGRQIVYYNLDDYSLYDPARAERTEALERELVERARLTACLSAHQTVTLRAKHPQRAERIRHFPLGVVDSFLNPDPATPAPVRGVGYVGNLSDRVDWAFVCKVADSAPDLRFHFVGALQDPAVRDGDWSRRRDRALALSNVVYEGPAPQAQVRLHYWRYAVNWMPYDPQHPFNIASCPTKIMDALASGRPFVSTDIPESRLYADRIQVVSSAEQTIDRLRRLLNAGSPYDPAEQVAFAAANTWRRRAACLIDILNPSADGADLTSFAEVR